jgi:phosphatidylserine/phosphatidylglycerophosphate/cardiolipin synthase-like enzyme
MEVPQQLLLAAHVRLVTERTVEKFLLRLFLRDEPVRSLCLISPYIDSLKGCRFTLVDLSNKIRRDEIPTYVVTREPTEDYQVEAMAILRENDWVEIRYNESIHAKVFLAATRRESESFALFGSGNLTGRSIRTNLEVGMMFTSPDSAFRWSYLSYMSPLPPAYLRIKLTRSLSTKDGGTLRTVAEARAFSHRKSR